MAAVFTFFFACQQGALITIRMRKSLSREKWGFDKRLLIKQGALFCGVPFITTPSAQREKWLLT